MGSAWFSFEARMANSSLGSARRVTAKQKAGAVFDPIPRRLNLIMIWSYVAHMSRGQVCVDWPLPDLDVDIYASGEQE
jgi:hypothetical protein